ncbi:rRNA methyltransferase 3, mitochondrial isoform X1 [Trachemys scripta elegans]|uniref:rRNA methyltransferase 3, mitochondrial isoform X1 n=1 Tax=Trachemys scripta elegans TaxID=31138 RepID=UPI00155283BB|nr:rRNA methyltransferase 3, mitochondrial isoform X1 [Trachemys scripta elegans]
MAALRRLTLGPAAALLRAQPGGAGAGAAAGRRWVRALRRSPVRVLPPRKEQRAAAPAGREPAEPKGARLWPAPEKSPAGQELRFEKAEPGDRRLGKVVTIAKSKKFRDQHGKILLEGQRLIKDALDAGAVPQTLFFSTVGHLKELPEEKLKKTTLVKVKFEDIKNWSDLITPQGLIGKESYADSSSTAPHPIFSTSGSTTKVSVKSEVIKTGIFSRPDHTKMTYPAVQQRNWLPLSLICDNLRDPGNLGTILRSAAGAGCSKVLLTKGCVDPWEPKVLRAGMGAHFRLPIIANLEWESISDYLPTDTQVYVADSHDPRTQDKMEDGSGKASSYGWVSRPHNLKAPIGREDLAFDSESEEEEQGTDEAWFPELDTQCYHENWTRAPAAAVVIGGETHGLSTEALRLAESTGGKRLIIPVVPGVDSLNSAMAASILLFEGKRQLQLREKQESKGQKFPALG